MMTNMKTMPINRHIAIKLFNFAFLLVTIVPSAQLLAQNNQNYPGTNASNRAPFLEQAKRILESVPLIDGHNDVPIQYRSRARYKLSQIDFNNTTQLERPMHTDIPRMRAGRVGGQFWSVYVPTNVPESESVQMTLEQIDFVYRLIDAFPDHFEIALTADDVERVFKSGKIASLIGMEGGQSIGNSLQVLRQMYELGARYMTITHARTLDWADAATDAPKHGGLTGFGEEVIREMNWLGMLVDLSHVSAETMRDAIRVSTAPVIFSHSSAMALNNHPRNVPDDVLDMLKVNNGIVMVTYIPAFIKEELHQHISSRNAERARLDYYYTGQPDKVSEIMRQWEAENPAPVATLETVADHIDHIKNRIGVDYIGIGGDYDGIPLLPEGLKDVSTYPDLFAELLYRGYTEDELRKIAGLNILRVMRDAEKESARLQKERPLASEAVITDY
jgi:membrane dipeptidase